MSETEYENFLEQIKEAADDFEKRVARERMSAKFPLTEGLKVDNIP